MSKRFQITTIVLAMAALLLAPSFSAADEIVDVRNYGDALVFEPVVEAADMILVVTGPCNYQLRRSLKEDRELVFQLDETTIDGRYRFQVTAIPSIDSGIIDVLQQARKSGDNSEVDQLCRDGKLPGDPQIQAAGFGVIKSEIVYDPSANEKSASLEKAAPAADPMAGLLASAPVASASGDATEKAVPLKDFVINDDLIVDGSACIGFDCVNGESFGFDTIRLKENNLRIKFDDTSTAASFPRNDWQLTANDSANGGLSKFSIDDVSGSRTPFTIEANAPSHSLYVDDGGRIGNTTSTPSVEMHLKDGDTPTLRLQQDTSSGFAAQTWDVAGNETNFFVRDTTNGSTLPFRIRPGASSSAIFIDNTSNVGLGTTSPDEELHLKQSDSDDVFVKIESTNGTTQNAGFTLVNTAATWNFFGAGNGKFRISGAPGTVLEIDDGTGEVTVNNDLNVVGTCTGCDAVFQPDWPLESIEEHAAAMWANSYLPAVGPTPEGNTAINVFEKVTGILQELEKAHIYIQQLHEEMNAQKGTIEALSTRLEELSPGE